jgi:alpha-1,2-glucosyltransferase
MSVVNSTTPLLVGIGLLAAVHAAVHLLFSKSVPTAYMDEVFHFPLTASYCDGDFAAWHPKVTTPPGLYGAGAAYSAALSALGATHGCGLTLLRSMNSAVAIATVALLAALLRELHPRMPAARAVLGACALGALPTHFFFAFLWYTDVASLFLVLSAYWLALRRHYWSSAATSCAALLFRQTNGVWAAFILGDAVLRSHPRRALHRGAADLGDWSVAAVAKGVRAATTGALWSPGPRGGAPRAVLALALPVVALAVFVVHYNGGRIALGDVANHTPCLHWAQLAYFVAFAAAFRFPLLPAALGALRNALRGARVARCVACAAAALGALGAAVHFGSFEHPFTLSDNRHYTFYIWKRVLGRGRGARLALVPAYALALWLLVYGILLRPGQRVPAAQGAAVGNEGAGEERAKRARRGSTSSDAARPPSALLVLGFALCTAAVLVPARLIEPRYFTVPWVLLHLHAGFESAWHAALPLGVFAAANAATVYLFVARPFQWPDGSTARFMW